MSIKCKSCVFSLRFKKGPFEEEYFVQCTKYGSGRCQYTIPEEEEIPECKFHISRGTKQEKTYEGEKTFNIRK